MMMMMMQWFVRHLVDHFNLQQCVDFGPFAGPHQRLSDFSTVCLGQGLPGREAEGAWSLVQKQTCKMRLCASHHVNLRKLFQFVALCPEGRFFCWLKDKDVPEDKVYMCMGPDVAHFRVDRQRLGPLCSYLCILQTFPQRTFTQHCSTVKRNSFLFTPIYSSVQYSYVYCNTFILPTLVLKRSIPVLANPSNLSNLQEKNFFQTVSVCSLNSEDCLCMQRLRQIGLLLLVALCSSGAGGARIVSPCWLKVGWGNRTEVYLNLVCNNPGAYGNALQ